MKTFNFLNHAYEVVRVSEEYSDQVFEAIKKGEIKYADEISGFLSKIGASDEVIENIDRYYDESYPVTIDENGGNATILVEEEEEDEDGELIQWFNV